MLLSPQPNLQDLCAARAECKAAEAQDDVGRHGWVNGEQNVDLVTVNYWSIWTSTVHTAKRPGLKRAPPALESAQRKARRLPERPHMWWALAPRRIWYQTRRPVLGGSCQRRLPKSNNSLFVYFAFENATKTLRLKLG